MKATAPFLRILQYLQRLLVEDLWKPATEYFRANRNYRRITVLLVIATFVINGVILLTNAAEPVSDHSEYKRIVEYAHDAQTTLQRANASSQFILDSISNDQYLPFYSQYTSSESFNSFLKKYQQLWLSSTFRASPLLRRQNTTEISIAFYDASNRLRGWYAPEFVSPSFDTIFEGGSVLERRSRLTQIDSDVFNLFYTTARKMISKQGYYIGYVVVKYRLAHQANLGELCHWQWDATQRTPDPAEQYYFSTRSAINTTTSSPLVYIDTTERSVIAGSFVGANQQNSNRIFADRVPWLGDMAGVFELLIVAMLFLLCRSIIEHSSSYSGRRMAGVVISVVVFFIAIRFVLLLLDAPAIMISGLPYFTSSFLFTSVQMRTFPSELFLSVGIAVLIFVFIRRALLFYVIEPRTRSKWFPLSICIGAAVLSIGMYSYFQYICNNIFGNYSIDFIESSLHSPDGFGLWVSLVGIGILYILAQYLLHTTIYYTFKNASFHRSSIAVVFIFFAVPQIAFFLALARAEWYYVSWNIAIISIFSVSLLLSYLYHSGYIHRLRQITHRTLQVVLIAVAAAVLIVLQLNEDLMQARVHLANREIQISSDQSGVAYGVLLNKTLTRFQESGADTNIKTTQQLHIQSLTFWNDFQHRHPKLTIGFTVTDPSSGRELYSIKSGDISSPSQSNANHDSLSGSSPDQFTIRLRDSTSSAARVLSSTHLVDLTLSVLSSGLHPLIPSTRLSEVLWSDSTIDSRKQQPTIIAIIPTGGLGPTRMAELGIDTSINSYVTFTRIVADTSRLLVPSIQQAAFVPFPRNKDAIHFVILLSEVFIVLTFLGFVMALVFRVIEQRTIRLNISLQEKVLLVVFFAIIFSYVFITQITSVVVASSTGAASNESFEHKKLLTLKEVQSVLQFDSATIIERHLTTIAEALNCDISLYNAQHAVISSTCNDCYRYSLIPEVLPSTLLEKLSQTASEEIVTTSVIRSSPVRLWLREIESIKQPGRKLTVLLAQKVEPFTALQNRITANVSDAITILALLTLLLSSYLASRIVRPLIILKEATQAVALGSLAISLPRKRNDEIGDVVDAFNAMTQELSVSRERVGQVEREGAWKEMARQVAHEIKNPLTPMKLSVQHVQHAFEHQDTNFPNIFRRVLRTLTEQIDVLTRIATEFARFGEMPRRRYAFVSVRSVVESAVSLFEAERARIRFAIDIPKIISKIYADDEEFRRALVNLIKNAVQAIDGWGVILITANERNGLVHLRISDSGSGMVTDTLKKAFDPNFSTKTSGMGLGLAIVKKTIVDMSGTITVESELGKGTTFHIELPARGGEGS